MSSDFRILEYFQDNFDENILDYKKLSDKVYSLEFNKPRFDNMAGREFIAIYYKLIVKENDEFKLKPTKFAAVYLNRAGNIVAEKIVFGKVKKIILDKDGKKMKSNKKELN